MTTGVKDLIGRVESYLPADRVQLVEEALVTQQMAYSPSEKSISKRVRWL